MPATRSARNAPTREAARGQEWARHGPSGLGLGLGFCAGLASAVAATRAQRRRGRLSGRRGTATLTREVEVANPYQAQRAFPFSAVVGQEEMKLALKLNLVDPVIGGVMISGDRGTGKSTTVRGLATLVPDIECVVGDPYNSSPTESTTQSDEVRAMVAAGEELPVELRRTPMVELPLGATEDRVTGTINIEKALLAGGKVFEPGILARVNRGILYIDEVNLLDDQLVDVLLDSAAGGWNTVEREGISFRHPARFVLIGSAHPDEGDIRPQLLDRFGLTVGVATQNGFEERSAVLNRTLLWQKDPASVERQFADEDAMVRKEIVEARGRLRDVKVSGDLRLKISTMCSKLNVDGLRGDIVVNRAACALAALEGRTEATEDDVRRVAVLCLQHRLRKDVVSDKLDNDMLVMEALYAIFPPPKRQED